MAMRMYEDWAVAGTIDPSTGAAGNYTSDWVALAKGDSALAVLMVGTMGTSSTVDFKLKQATDGSGTGAKDIAGKVATQLTQGGGDSNKQVVIEVDASELDLAGGYGYIAARVTVGTAATPFGVVLFRRNYNKPASGDMLTSVAQIVF